MKNTLYDQLVETRSNSGDSVYLMDRNASYSFNDALLSVNAFADDLVKLGVGHGDRVLYVALREIDTVLLHIACNKIGAVYSIIDGRGDTEKNQSIVDRFQPKLIVIAEIIDRAQFDLKSYELESSQYFGGCVLSSVNQNMAIPRSAIASDLGLVFYTSGSTGDSKGVALSHSNVLFAGASIAEYLRLGSEDRIYNSLPLFFDYGYYQLLLPLFCGCSVYVANSFMVPQKNLSEIRQTQCTVFPVVPSMARLLARLKKVESNDAVLKITNTGEAIHRTEIGSIRQLFPSADIYSMYGLTECKRTTYLPPEQYDRFPDSVGIAIPGTRVEVVDEDRQVVPNGTVGQIVVSGPHLMMEYLEMPEATDNAIYFDVNDKQRKLATGDFGHIDKHGNLYLSGRKDDVYKIDGRKYSCIEQEALMKSYPEIADVCVIVESETRKITAYIVVEADTTIKDELIVKRLFNASSLSSHVPSAFIRVNELPMNGNGKHDKKRLRQQLQDNDDSIHASTMNVETAA